MGIYRKIHVKMYEDTKFRRLSGIRPCGQSLWMYLLTGPHTRVVPGFLRANPRTLAADLGWTQEDFDACFAEIVGEGMALCDPEAKLIWLPQAIKHNPPASPNVIAKWGADLAMLPECDLLVRAVRGPDGLMEKMAEVNPAYADGLMTWYEKHAGRRFPEMNERNGWATPADAIRDAMSDAIRDAMSDGIGHGTSHGPFNRPGDDAISTSSMTQNDAISTTASPTSNCIIGASNCVIDEDQAQEGILGRKGKHNKNNEIGPSGMASDMASRMASDMGGGMAGGMGCGIQKQEQKQEQDQKGKNPLSPPVGGERATAGLRLHDATDPVVMADGAQSPAPPAPPAPAVRPRARPSMEAQQAFARFWQVWPRKVAKAKAEKAWTKLAPDPEMEAQILAAVAAQASSPGWVKDGGAFIPHAATWLNGRRWEDEVGPVAAPAPDSAAMDVPEAMREDFVRRVAKSCDEGWGFSQHGYPVVNSRGEMYRRLASGAMEEHYGPRFTADGRRIAAR